MAFTASKTNARTTPRYTGMQLQTAAYGAVVPVVYGTARTGWNLGDYVNFQSHRKSSGGKGGIVGGGGKGGQLDYTASILGIICEGPITGIHSSWSSQTQSAGTPGFSVFDGAIAQTPWSYLTTSYPSHALTYSGFACAAAQNYDLGASANLPNINWEVEGFYQGSAPGTYGGNACVTGGDADPSKVLPDILSNTQYGIGFPTSRIGQVASNSENHAVPNTGPYTVTVNNASSFLYNVDVVDGAGNIYTCVASSPGALQYSFNTSTGVYTFNAAQAGVTVSIRYASVGALNNYQDFCLASGLWISPVYAEQTQISSCLDDLALATFSEIVWSSGVLQVLPRGTQAITANGYTFTPSTTPLFSLGLDDFMPNTNPTGTISSAANDDPVIVSRTRASDQINNIKIEALDRANQYVPTLVEVFDMALINRWGRRASASKQLHMFCDINAANVSAHLQLQDEYIRNTYSFQLDERYAMLDPMDLVELTDPDYPGLANIGARILEITENDDGTLSIVAEEYPGAIGTVPAYSLNTGQGLIQDFNVDPGNAMAPAIFDVPVGLVQKLGLETWLATCSATGNPNWGGCDIYLSSDGTTYEKVGSLNAPSRMGTLTGTFPSGSDPDTTNTLSVDLTESFGTLTAGTTADADAENTICYVDGEYISYSAATLTATYKYNLGTYLRRGQGGSTIASHASGALFVRLDDGVFRMPYTPAAIGTALHVKLVSFNIFGGGYQDLSSVTAYTHTIAGPPAQFEPSGLTLTAGIKSIQLSWTNPTGFGNVATQIWRSATSAFSGASQVGTTGANANSIVDLNVSSNTQYWYWIRSVDLSGNTGPFVPASSGAGGSTTTLSSSADVQDSGAASAGTLSTSWQTMATASITTTGGDVVVQGVSIVLVISGANGMNWRLQRDGATIASGAITQTSGINVGLPVQYVDTPSAGSHTYDFDAQLQHTSSSCTWTNASLVATAYSP